MASPGRLLHLSENLTLPFDRRVWMELNALRAAGWEVSAICPMGDGGTEPYEVLNDIHIWRYPAPPVTRKTIEPALVTGPLPVNWRTLPPPPALVIAELEVLT